MGYPMAGHLHNQLKQQGGQVCVYNRTVAKAEQWQQQYGGAHAATPAAAASDCQVVLLCVGNDDDVRSVVYGEQGVLAGMQAGSILVDHTTASAELARELAEACRERDIDFIDAPVSGGQAGAENGMLTTMAGGQQQAFERCQPVFASYCKTQQLMGEAGAGQLAKMVNQICIAGVLQGLSEGLHLAKQVGLDADKLVAAISQGAAGSWQMQNRYKTMWQGDYEHGFAVDWMRKDLAIALQEANRQGVSLPLTALVDQFYGEVQRMGGQRWDTSSLLARLESFTKQ